MADQKKNAGNIGDVIKHALLPPLVNSFVASHTGTWIYCETHAGYHDYPLAMLKEDASWKGERAWSVGLLEQSGQLQTLGEYGKELVKSLGMGVYPGSIRLIASLRGSAHPARILGWDIAEEQVASFANCEESVVVSQGNGYDCIASFKDENRLVFCDPFWTADDENSKVQALIERESAVVVWYPLSGKTVAFREWLNHQSHPSIELRFRHYTPSRNGWAGQDLQGAGMMFKGLPISACDGAVEIGRRLKGIFENRTHASKARKANSGGQSAKRDLSLRLILSL